MKKILKGLSLSIIMLMMSAVNALPLPPLFRPHIWIPHFYDSYFFTIGALYLDPSIPQLNYAIIFPDATSTTNGKAFSANPDYDLGLHVNVGATIPNTGNDIVVDYQGLVAHEDNLVLRPTNGLLERTLSSDSQTFFAVVVTSIFGPAASASAASFFNLNVDTARAKTTFRYNVVNLEAGQHIFLGERTKFRLFAGVRYLYFDHKLFVLYASQATNGPINVVTADFNVDVTNTVFINESVTQESEFHGAGPTFGAKTDFALGGGFSLIGQFGASLIGGVFENRLQDRVARSATANVTINSGTVVEIITEVTLPVPPNQSIDYTALNQARLIPNLDGKLGIAFTAHPTNRNLDAKLGVEFGYQFSHYYDLVDRQSGQEGSSPERLIRRVNDASFDGVYLDIHVQV